jgi:hypothetical protein
MLSPSNKPVKTGFSLSKLMLINLLMSRRKNLLSYLKEMTFIKCYQDLLLQVSGRMKMSRKVFCANFSVVQKKISLQPKEEDSEVKSTVFWLVIHLLLNLKFYPMSIDALQEESTHQVKVVQPLVLLLMYQRTLRLVSLF